MGTRYSILYLEGDQTDFEFLRDLLEEEGVLESIVWVKNRHDFVAALCDRVFDINLVDYNLPDIDGITALKIALKKDPDIPVVLISGTVGEEIAIEALKEGAADYVLKDRLIVRLVPVLKKALDDAEEKRKGKQAEARYASLVANIPGVVYRCACDRDWIMEFVSNEIEKLTGYPASDFIQNKVRSFLSIINPDERQRIEDAVLDSAKRGVSWDIEYRIVHRDGDIRWVHERGQAIKSDERILWLDGVIFDITERKKSEEELLKLAAVIEQAAEIIMITDTDGFMQYVNPSFSKVTGYSYGEAVGRKSSILKSGKQSNDYYQKLWTVITSGEIWRGHFQNKKKDGSVYEEDVVITPIKNDKGTIINYVAIKRDVTLEIMMAGQLRQAQKMESIGTLAGGIAHDFNNILSAIIGYSEISIERLEGFPEIQKSLHQVLKGAFRAGDLVSQILTFSRSSNIERKEIKTSPILKEACKFLRASLPTTIEIHQSLDVKNDWILADSTQFQQILMNICTNAGYAMKKEGGVLTVQQEEVSLEKEDLLTFPNLKIGSYLKLTVEDTGAGIAKENLERIFEPYFTTKEKGEGTGLGLAVVHGIVRDYGGQIKIYSEIGMGTVCHVLFPLIKKAIEDEQPESLKPLLTGNETILFVDDEEVLVRVVKIILEDLGYKVTTVTDAEEAIETLELEAHLYDLIITDKTMPKINGFQLAKRIRKFRSDIPIILCSGFAEKNDNQRMVEAGINDFILKPFYKQKLAERIRSVLDRKGG